MLINNFENLINQTLLFNLQILDTRILLPNSIKIIGIPTTRNSNQLDMLNSNNTKEIEAELMLNFSFNLINIQQN